MNVLATGLPDIIRNPSPNHDDRQGKIVDLLLIHYTGMESADAALERLLDSNSKVSAHYLIDEDGQITQLVEEDRRAWHAGEASWAGERDINGCSIGIELVNPGHEFGYRDFPDSQMESLIVLCRDILTRHLIAPSRVLGHSDVAPARKQDPGERFDWARLSRAGIGLWPMNVPWIDPLPDASALLEQFAIFGYGTEDATLEEIVTAFQRHYRPSSITGRVDGETAGILARLIGRLDQALARS
jgi:N-acetylmuramoyl-L-alanine amidase